MNTRIETVIESFREYLKAVKYVNDNGYIQVEYTPIAYDYIDDDLDFDEDYYASMCKSFQTWLETTALDMIRQSEASQIRIVQNRMIFRDTDYHVETNTYSVDQVVKKILHTKEKYLSFES
jgi:hypothetical protein